MRAAPDLAPGTSRAPGPDPAQDLTRVAAVAAAIRERIAARALVPGARLPSVRGFAAAMRVSKSTVVEAYDRLVAEGAIVSRPGSGFYVAGATRPLTLAAIGPRLDRAVDPLWVTRQTLEAAPGVLKPGCGWLPPSWMPDAGLRRGLRALARDEAADLLDYDEPLGHAPLRARLARRLGEQGIPAEPGQIILTDSATQALDLIARLLLEPGDAVLVDDPCYFNFRALLQAHRARVVGVPWTPAGPDLDAFAAALAAHRPRLYLTNSALQNPTGATMSAASAHRVLRLAAAHDALIVEDALFDDFEPAPSPRLAALDGLDRVIRIGSFSKTLSAAIRCGHIAVRPDWVDRLVDLKLATSFGSGRLSASLVHAVLADGHYRRHLDALRARLADAMGLTAQRLGALGLVPWLMPRGGLFLWAALPEGLDAAAVARRALAEDVVLAPGNVFSLSQSAGRHLRFNVAQCAEPRVFGVLARAMEG
ncbi:PLP-dependent aminotransferase family protein [Methylobacterium isbiliense]|uniref:8-amino-7-oxononanoate synthase n=1 Tax=Methylobacterium isbiliense TaxID=315478 RepID=A0ABQ4SJ38_9HYPH|nr:PLP-dependent aminotransferase family protein [Methylobacterium isbiliense]MDN3624693.1 PLP-dependent aminotransferase family protein [Methylobacterium isbiliense]GJE02443.1 HTH-type transcriptional regulator NorG [Methylobacterium isbiliense]